MWSVELDVLIDMKDLNNHYSTIRMLAGVIVRSLMQLASSIPFTPLLFPRCENIRNPYINILNTSLS